MSGAVIVVGSINVDLRFGMERLPRPGETVTGARFDQTGGGKGANQAVSAARLGASTYLVGCLGDDSLGAGARVDLELAGVDMSGVRTVTEPTGVAAVFVDSQGENSIAVAPGANAVLAAADIDDTLAKIEDLESVAGQVVLLVSLEVPLAAVQRAAQQAHRRGWTVVLNPAPAVRLPQELVALCDVLTPNEHEVDLLGWDGVQGLLNAGASAVVLTRGRHGADLIRPGREPYHVAALPVEVVDTTGAGDCFSGALAAALAAGGTLPDSVRVAAAAGSLATCGSGARGSLPSVRELREVAPAAVAAVPGWS